MIAHAMAAVSNGQAPSPADMQTPREADGGDASAVASLVTWLRLRPHRLSSAAVESPLRDERSRHNDDDAVFALLPPGRRMRPLSAQSSAARHRRDLDTLVRTLCRRFAGHLVVQGKLLNHEELLVRQIACLVPHEEDAERDNIFQLPSDAVMRFLVLCDDAPASLVGHEHVAAVVVASSDPLPDDSTIPRIRVSHTATLKPSTLGRIDAIWSTGHHQLLESADQVFGFSVRSFLALGDDHSSARWEDDDVELSANERIERHSAFTDLRGVQSMMRRAGLDAMQWLSLAETPVDDRKVWSHTALATAQKTRWSNDRVTRGDDLVNSGHKKQALAEFTGAIKLDDANAAAWSRRGRLYLELRQYEDAIRDLERVVQLNSAGPEVLESLLRAKSKLSHSKHVVTSVTTLAPTVTPTMEARRVDIQPPRESAAKSSIEALEKDRLRRLLEEEEDARRRHKKRRRSSRRSRSRSRDSDSSDSDSSGSESDSSRSHRRRKSKKSKKSKDKKRKKSSKASKRRQERSDSDDDRESVERRRRRARRRETRSSRSRCRSRSRSRERRRRRSESVASSRRSNSQNGTKH